MNSVSTLPEFDMEEISKKLLDMYIEDEKKSVLAPGGGKKLLTPPKYKLYFSGEFDSNQTKFEKRSNNLEIAVVAKHSRCAWILLSLLRTIIDGEQSMRIIYEDSRDWDEFVRTFCYTEEAYTTEWPLDADIFETTLHYGSETIEIRKSLSEVDVWTYSRIKENTC
jgi:hypothetical protein